MLNKFFSLLRRARRYWKQSRDLSLIRNSGLFDERWYLAHNPDVVRAQVDPLLHYYQHGGFKGRDPGPEFSSNWYLNTYKDVKKAGINPLVHYLKYGRTEGRLTRPQKSKNANSLLNMDLSRIISKNQKCDFFFIIGTGRCGTTLMAQVMNAHSQVCVPHELQIIFEHGKNGARLAEIFASYENVKFRANEYIKLIETRCPHNFHAYYDYNTFFERLNYPILSLRWLLTSLYTDIARSQAKSLFAEQTPWYGQNIKLLNRLFPKSKFIHMVRDGRDVAISFARTRWWHKDVNLNLEQWEGEVNKIEEDASLLLKDRMLTIRYEDLISSPDEVIKKACSFLHVAFEETMLDPNFHIDYRQFSKHDNAEISSSAYRKWQNEKKSAFFSESVYSWKTNKEVNFGNMSNPITQTLQRFGYDVP